jgi:hypothetical protein
MKKPQRNSSSSNERESHSAARSCGAGHFHIGRIPKICPQGNVIPSWILISYTIMVFIIVPVYWIEYGPANFLWFSDIALLLMLPALWLNNRLLSSMMAVGVLPLEIIWMISFFSRGALGHMTDYMFDPNLSIFLRGLSLFHFPLPVVIIYMLMRFGYDRRALLAQTMLALVVIPLTYTVTKPEDNINWVYSFDKIQISLPPLIYLTLLALTMVGAVFAPMHFLLKRLFPSANAKKNVGLYS